MADLALMRFETNSYDGNDSEYMRGAWLFTSMWRDAQSCKVQLRQELNSLLDMKIV